MAVRVMVLAHIRDEDAEAFEAAFAEVTRKVRGTPGHRGDELLRSASEPGCYILLSEWESREAFVAWEDAPIHRQTTTPMRPYWSGPVTRTIYDLAVRLA